MLVYYVINLISLGLMTFLKIGGYELKVKGLINEMLKATCRIVSLIPKTGILSSPM